MKLSKYLGKKGRYPEEHPPTLRGQGEEEDQEPKCKRNHSQRRRQEIMLCNSLRHLSDFQ